MKCCICGKEIKGYGNDPWGALDENGDEINWKDDDECCDDCNNTYVLAGRMARLYAGDKKTIQQLMGHSLVKRK